MTRAGRIILAALVAAALAAAPAAALETDQFYAWGRELTDAAPVLNAKINAEVLLVLERLNERKSPPSSCSRVVRELKKSYVWFIFQDIEIWAQNTPLVERIPATPEEEIAYRQESLYSLASPMSIGTSIPPSPTIQADGIRFGTDKLSHFFSVGWRYYRRYMRARDNGHSREQAEDIAIRKGAFFERTILGWASSGVLSPGDLEANFEGMRFYAGLCEGETPRFGREDGRWVLKRRFDIADHVSPTWDESYRPPIYRQGRWKKVKPVMERYCGCRNEPWVAAQRERYRAEDRSTPTDRFLAEQVESGKYRDPEEYSLERVCRELEADGDRAEVPRAAPAGPR